MLLRSHRREFTKHSKTNTMIFASLHVTRKWKARHVATYHTPRSRTPHSQPWYPGSLVSCGRDLTGEVLTLAWQSSVNISHSYHALSLVCLSTCSLTMQLGLSSLTFSKTVFICVNPAEQELGLHISTNAQTKCCRALVWQSAETLRKRTSTAVLLSTQQPLRDYYWRVGS